MGLWNQLSHALISSLWIMHVCPNTHVAFGFSLSFLLQPRRNRRRDAMLPLPLRQAQHWLTSSALPSMRPGPQNHHDSVGIPSSDEQQLYIALTRRVLEDQWMASRRKSRPRFYTYDLCKQWVQAQNLCHNQEEWISWIEMGEKRNCLVPQDPQTEYQRQGTWISWEDFLGSGNATLGVVS